MTNVIYVRATAAEVRRQLHGLPAALARGGAGNDLARGLLLRLGVTMLSLVKQRFVVLARGGTYEGERWAPLAPSTIARRLARGRKATKGKKPPGTAGLLEIGRVDGTMFNSLSPGIDGPSGDPNQIFRLGSGEVVVGTRAVSRRNGFPYPRVFHRGRKHQPARTLWPAKLPVSWGRALGEAARSGVIRAVTLLLTGGRGGPG